MPTVDIIVPCYNYACYLNDCVTSILNQSWQDVRILIINDASPDNTSEIATHLATFDTRITVITHAVNQGHIATYNEGLKWATGDYVMLLSADDMLAPGALRRAVRVMEINTNVVLTYGACEHLMPDSSIGHLRDEDSSDPPWRIITGSEFIEIACRIADNFVPTPTVIVRNKTHKQVGGYRPELFHSGDGELWLRLASQGDVAVTSATQAIKREHRSNMSTQISTNLATVYRQRLGMFDYLFRYYHDDIPRADALRLEAQRVLAEKAFWHSLGKLVEGRFSDAAELRQTAFELAPELRLRPPLGRLLNTPGVTGKIKSVFRNLASNLPHLKINP